MKTSVIIDTNKARNEQSFDQLLGSRKALAELAHIARLVIPEIVLEEIIQQKREFFEAERGRLAGNRLIGYLNILVEDVESLSFDPMDKALRSDQSIPYELASIADPNEALSSIAEWAVRRQPPFEKNTDKGFKDACIAISTEAYAKSHPDECVFLLTEDKRLSEYFEKSASIHLAKDIKELKERIASQDSGQADFTVDTAAEQTECTPPPNTKKDELFSALIRSGSFLTTHSLISQLSAMSSEFTPEDKIKLLQIALDNSQVNWILRDEDVFDFYYPLFEECEPYLDKRQYADFIQYLGIEDVRAKKLGDIRFTDEEKETYRRFGRELISSIVSISSWASIDIESEEIVSRLKTIKPLFLLEDDLPIRQVIECFIDGSFELNSPADITRESLEKFTDMLIDSIPAKRDIFLFGIRNKLAELPKMDDDIPF